MPINSITGRRLSTVTPQYVLFNPPTRFTNYSRATNYSPPGDGTGEVASGFT